MTMTGILKFNNRNSGENYFKKWNSFQYSWLPDMIAAKTSYGNNDVVVIRIDQRQKGGSNESDQRKPKHIQSGRPRDRSVEVIGKMRKHIDQADGVLTFNRQKTYSGNRKCHDPFDHRNGETHGRCNDDTRYGFFIGWPEVYKEYEIGDEKHSERSKGGAHFEGLFLRCIRKRQEVSKKRTENRDPKKRRKRSEEDDAREVSPPIFVFEGAFLADLRFLKAIRFCFTKASLAVVANIGFLMQDLAHVYGIVVRAAQETTALDHVLVRPSG